jgi:hypothetical protein
MCLILFSALASSLPHMGHLDSLDISSNAVADAGAAGECVCVCVCLYVCLCVCMHACMHVSAGECVCVYMCVCMYVCMCVCMHACVCRFVCIRMYVCMYACMCVSAGEWGCLPYEEEDTCHMRRRIHAI